MKIYLSIILSFIFIASNVQAVLFKNVNGVRVQLTAKEESARNAEEVKVATDKIVRQEKNAERKIIEVRKNQKIECDTWVRIEQEKIKFKHFHKPAYC